MRGLRDNIKRKNTFLFCRRYNADFIFLQETHSSVSDSKFWKAQWGNMIYFSHGSNNLAGVLILIHRFKGDIVNYMSSSENRWIILTVKLDNAIFIICNIYGFNSHSMNNSLFTDISLKLSQLQETAPNAKLIIAGDFNETPDTLMDRFPGKFRPQCQSSNIIDSLCNDLSLVDCWHYFNSNSFGYTWSNSSKSLKSRIDLFLISSSLLQHVQNICHQYAPFSDHLLIELSLQTIRKASYLRGYWKCNNSLLEDNIFIKNIESLASNIFDSESSDFASKWELFKFKSRDLAIKRRKNKKI